MAPPTYSDKRFESTGRIGTFACSAQGGRIVRVAAARGVAKPPRMVDIDSCPVCERPHRVAITWRQQAPRDEGREPELIVGDAPLDPTTSSPENHDRKDSP